MKLPLLKKRASFLLFFIFLWAIIIIAHLFYYSVYNSEYYKRKCRALSEISGIIPARRGKIFDVNKIKLAWNEIFFDLYLKPYDGFPGRRKVVFKTLSKIFGKIDYIENDNTVCIKRNISPLQQIKCVDFIRHFPELFLRLRVLRQTYSIPDIKDIERKKVTNIIIGKVISNESGLHGVSGLEKKYDSQLLGKSGHFSVMIDRFGNWIPGTWKELQKPHAGKDIILNLSLEQMIKEYKEKCLKK
jgi:cell division protein FtsI/penicillin-binding protein 2